MPKILAFAPNGAHGLEPCRIVPAESLLGPAPTEQGAVLFSEGSQTCGIWEATPYAERMDEYPFNEMAHILSGRVAITPDEGTTRIFGPGDTLLRAEGIQRSLRSDGDLPEILFHR